MKVRMGFVSNSSSSSFICDVCDQRFHGWDASPRDFEHYYCPKEHIVCSGELIDVDGGLYLDQTGWGDIDSRHCPVCNFQVYAKTEMAQYLERKYEVSRDKVFAEIKALNRRRKKLYDDEYISYVLKQFSLTDTTVLDEIRSKFKTHDEFRDFLRSK